MSEEQQKIQKYIIKSSPYGELPEVIKDLDKISPLNLQSQTIKTAIQEYNEEHLSIIPTKEGNFVITSVSRVDQTHYLDQSQKRILTVDHTKLTLISIEHSEEELAEPVEELAKALNQSIGNYVQKYFKDPCGHQVHMSITEDGLDVYIAFTGKNVELANCYTGEWNSKWKINKQFIEGTITIKAHFFQSGNVQFNQKKTFKKEFQFKPDMAENAKTIAKTIEKFEGDTQVYLNEVYEEMPNSFFKHLRRVTPLTKTKMVWNLNSVKMNKTLMEVSK